MTTIVITAVIIATVIMNLLNLVCPRSVKDHSKGLLAEALDSDFSNNRDETKRLLLAVVVVPFAVQCIFCGNPGSMEFAVREPMRLYSIGEIFWLGNVSIFVSAVFLLNYTLPRLAAKQFGALLGTWSLVLNVSLLAIGYVRLQHALSKMASTFSFIGLFSMLFVFFICLYTFSELLAPGAFHEAMKAQEERDRQWMREYYAPEAIARRERRTEYEERLNTIERTVNSMRYSDGASLTDEEAYYMGKKTATEYMDDAEFREKLLDRMEKWNQ